MRQVATPTSVGHLRTCRCDALGRRSHNLDDPAPGKPLLFLQDLDDDLLARQRTGDEHDPATVVAPKRLAARRQSGRFEKNTHIVTLRAPKTALARGHGGGATTSGAGSVRA